MKKVKKRTAVTLFTIILIVTSLITGCQGSSKFSQDNTPSPNDVPGDSASKPVKDGNADSEAMPEDTEQQPTPDAEGDNSQSQADHVENPAKKDIKVKGIYLTGWTAGSSERFNKLVDLAKTTEINTFVIDIKDDDGLVSYESEVPEVRKAGTWTKKYDVNKVIKELHDNNIHVIGRIVCFKDPAYSEKNTELAIKLKNGELWKEKNSDGRYITWLNAGNRASWAYLINIAKEAIEKGFDEIQFDYIRFPSGDKSNMDLGKQDIKKYEVINNFLDYARKELPGVVLSADIFGIVCISQGDREDIGQHLEETGKHIDYFSPMVYPSHYALGQIINNVKFAIPDLDPYGVVYNTLVRAKERLDSAHDYNVKMRPYLQAFTASYLGKGYYQEYGSEQLKQQIKAVYDAGYEEWIFWDARNRYNGAAGFQRE